MNRTAMVHRGTVVQLAEMHGGAAPSLGYVYAIGKIQWSFGAPDIEKEYLQLLPDPPPAGLTTETQRVQYVLQQHTFLAREMHWLFMINGQPAYRLIPRSKTELDDFIASMVPSDPTVTQYSVIVGTFDPSGGELPGVLVNHTHTFTLQSLASSVTSELTALKYTNIPSTQQIVNVFDQTLQLANNTGDLDEHRALNYVSVNYPQVYMLPTMQGATSSNLVFTGVETRHSVNDAGGVTVIEVIFKYQNQNTGVPMRFFTSVDVTGQFPYIVQKFQIYFER